MPRSLTRERRNRSEPGRISTPSRPSVYDLSMQAAPNGGLRRYRGPGGRRLGLGTGRGCSGEEQRGLRRGGVEDGSTYSRSPPRARWPDRVLVRMEASCAAWGSAPCNPPCLLGPWCGKISSRPPASYTVALFYLIPYYCIKKYRAPPQHPLSPFSLTKMIEEKTEL